MMIRETTGRMDKKSNEAKGDKRSIDVKSKNVK